MKKLRLMNGYNTTDPKREIGILEYIDDRKVYVFTYSDIDETLKVSDWFWKVPGIPRENKTTESEKLFWFFADRIPPRHRIDFPDMLQHLGLKKYDEWEFLKASGSRLATDKFELVEWAEGNESGDA